MRNLTEHPCWCNTARSLAHQPYGHSDNMHCMRCNTLLVPDPQSGHNERPGKPIEWGPPLADAERYSLCTPYCDDCELPVDVCACEEAEEYDRANPFRTSA